MELSTLHGGTRNKENGLLLVKLNITMGGIVFDFWGDKPMDDRPESVKLKGRTGIKCNDCNHDAGLHDERGVCYADGCGYEPCESMGAADLDGRKSIICFETQEK